MIRNVRFWAAGVGAAGGSALAAAMIGAGVAPAAHATGDDSVGIAGGTVSDTALAAASSSNQYDPAVFDYSADPSNLFSPVYTVAPVGPEDVEVTTAAGDIYGTQDFTLTELGIPVDTFTGNVEYTPTPFDEATGLSGILSQLSQELGSSGGYSEEITTLGSPGTLLPDPTSFLIDEFGFGYGNVFEESMNTAGTSATVGDYVLTPFGDENITPIVDLFLPQGAGINDAAGAVSAAADGASVTTTTLADVLSDATTNYTDSNQLLTELSSSATSYAPAIATQIQFQDQALDSIANLGSAQSALSSYDNGLLSEFLNPLFTNVDQSWDQVSEAALTADQAAETAVGSGSTTDIATAMLGLAGPEYQALGPDIQSAFIDVAAHWLTGGDFTSIGDIASSLDPASAVDPSVFADLLSSIGL